MLRYGSLFASSFITGYAQAKGKAGTTITSVQTGVTDADGNPITVPATTTPNWSSNDQVKIGLGKVGEAFSQIIAENVNTPPTVTVDSGTGIGILLTSDMDLPKVLENA